MTRIEPDGLIDSFDPRTKAEHPDEKPAYLRSTVLRAIDETRRAGGEVEDGWHEALDALRARFQPTEGENGHE